MHPWVYLFLAYIGVALILGIILLPRLKYESTIAERTQRILNEDECRRVIRYIVDDNDTEMPVILLSDDYDFVLHCCAKQDPYSDFEREQISRLAHLLQINPDFS